MKKKVDFSGIKFTVWKIGFNFKLKKVSLEDILTTLISPELEEIGYVSFGQIVHTLNKMPFNVRDPDELINLSTYLVEDSNNGYKVHDNTQQSVLIVKSIFRKLLVSYEGKNVREWENCNNRVLAEFERRQLHISEALKEIPDNLTMQEVSEKILEYQISLDSWELNHLLWKLFLITR